MLNGFQEIKKVGGGKSPMFTHESDSTTQHIVTKTSEWTQLQHAQDDGFTNFTLQ